MTFRERHVEDAVEAAAAGWIARRDAGLTSAEQDEFDRWVLSDPRHAAAVAEFSSIWNVLGRPRRTVGAPAIKGEYTTRTRQRQRRRASLIAVASVGVLALGFLVPWSGLRLTAVSAEHAVVLLPDRRVLPDGTVVDLKKDSDITVSFEEPAGVRRVILQAGEAHFAVAKDVHRPFVVTVGGVEVRAVGTAFSVQKSADQVEILVSEGTVSVEKTGPPGAVGSANDSRVPDAAAPPWVEAGVQSAGRSEMLVAAGNAVIVDRRWQSVPPRVTPVPESELNDRLAWRSPRVEFSRAPLSEVVKVVNRYNQVQFKITDDATGRVKLSGLFRADDASAFAHALERHFGITSRPLPGGDIALGFAR